MNASVSEESVMGVMKSFPTYVIEERTVGKGGSECVWSDIGSPDNDGDKSVVGVVDLVADVHYVEWGELTKHFGINTEEPAVDISLI